VLPSNLNRLLIIVVVLSMALTPLLNELGRVLAKMIDEFTEVKEVDADAQLQIAEAVEPIVIIGFGQLGQVS
jgi:stage III sporulation protein SpoIIIAA